MQIRWFLPTLAAGAWNAYAGSDETFIVRPYLQLGNRSALAAREAFSLLWHAPDRPDNFAVSVRTNGAWSKPAPVTTHRRIAVRTIDPHRVYRAPIEGLRPGLPFEYRVLNSGTTVFEGQGIARKSVEQPYRFVVFGDAGQASPAQRMIAQQTLAARPDFVFITGDIVYGRGRISEYRPKFFDVYDRPTTALLRSIPFIAAPGNHDIANTDLTVNPDGLAYFYYWDQPLNGATEGEERGRTPILQGEAADQKAFRESAGGVYPKMANFSFDYGNSHWTVIDTNRNIDWRDPALRAWIKRDLTAAQHATWKIVGFHHPGIQSSRAHAQDHQARVLCDLFEECGVDLVLAGHVHNYQRTYPLRFRAAPGADPTKLVPGEFILDRKFDGATVTRPDGIIYIVTGAGGAGLYDPLQQVNRDTWNSFTTRFVSQVNSLSVVDVNGKTLTYRQLDVYGAEVDRFTLTKS